MSVETSLSRFAISCCRNCVCLFAYVDVKKVQIQVFECVNFLDCTVNTLIIADEALSESQAPTLCLHLFKYL